MKVRPKLLVVDDQSRYIELCHALLPHYRYATLCQLPGPCAGCSKREGCELTHAHDAAEVFSALSRDEEIDVVLLDLRFELPEERLLPRGRSLKERQAQQGLAILEKIRARYPAMPVILMTSESALPEEDLRRLEVDEYAIMAGEDAFDARALGLLIDQVVRPSGLSDSRYVFGTSRSMQRLQRHGLALARTSLPMLLLGETGTGKSALARDVLHPASQRKGAFVAVDVSAIPENLVAAELFGTAPGAFSGAVGRAGRFEEADAGTLFLDEIGNLSLSMQRLLLLALQSGEVTRLGENRSRSVDVKVIAATHADLAAEVRAGRFRADLLARLNPAAALSLPPLRERKQDLLLLARKLLKRRLERAGDRALLQEYAARARVLPEANLEVAGESTSSEGLRFVLSPRTFAQMNAHDWPGNLRELENAITTLVLVGLAAALRDETESPIIPLPERLADELLRPVSGTSASEIPPQDRLRDLSTLLEREFLRNVYFECGGDFEKMAKRLLKGESGENARRVRTRFNQLGLRARELKAQQSLDDSE